MHARERDSQNPAYVRKVCKGSQTLAVFEDVSKQHLRVITS